MSNSEKTLWQHYRFSIILLLSITIGSVIGLVMGKDALVLEPFGKIFLNLMFTVVVPLVFVTISSAVGNMVNMQRLGKIVGSMFATFLATGLIAAVLIIIAVKIWPPALGVNIPMQAPGALEAVKLSDAIVKALTVGDFRDLLSKGNMLPLIVFSMMFGFCVSATGGEDGLLGRVLESLSNVMMKFVELIMLYAPIGLGAYFATLIGEFGPQLLGAYGRAMLIYYPLCVLYFVVFFPLYAWFAAGREGVSRMLKFLVTPAITALATQSSIATLPVNLEAAKNIGIPKDIREIVLPIGATMHMDGTVLSSILKISFMFGLFGYDFSGPGTFASAILISVLGGVVMSGIPGGGLIGELLIVSLYGFPMEAFPIIATIGFLVDPPATCINATGDTVASMIVSRFVEGKDWITRNLG